MTGMHGPIVLAAGGTGGHTFPARALAEALVARGWRIALVTDARGSTFAEAANGMETHRIPAASPSGGALSKMRGLSRLVAGTLRARRILRRLAPAAAVGFGGYPSVPTMWAASGLRIPALIHEQNALLGRANRLLASRVDRIATSFDSVAGIGAGDRRKVAMTGNPVRAGIASVARHPYPRRTPADAMRLLAFGGSQGARVLSDVVPAAIAALPAAARERLSVVQQCRAEDLERVRDNYRRAAVEAELATFFDDMPERLAAAHLVVARAGASTVAELAAAGRPALLVPYRHALDDHQMANARAVDAAGGGWIMPEDGFTPDALSARLQSFLASPATLEAAAEAARGTGRADAAARLADEVEALAGAAARCAGSGGDARRETAA